MVNPDGHFPGTPFSVKGLFYVTDFIMKIAPPTINPWNGGFRSTLYLRLLWTYTPMYLAIPTLFFPSIVEVASQDKLIQAVISRQ